VSYERLSLKREVSLSESKLKTFKKELTMEHLDTFLTTLYVMVDDLCKQQGFT